ncbi:PLD nuclease N-terminal domain-containing protein [Arcanobacterium phocae]|uniref:PLD nuclease N-terminal domain-containing protein n=1 Tax=Arcanobacterium phocae TaxID=131112 RepID=UPI001C0EDFBF|nr:PLD nuclease N-terminal domain-containing protein [Arcanobacterium phocae]
MARILIVLTALALHIYTFIDVLRTDRNNLPARLPKAAWAVLTLIVPLIGPLLWLFFKNQDLFRSGTTLSSDSLRKPFGTGTKSNGPVAPDDDPEFLARLEARNRRRAYEQQKRAEAGLDPEEELPEDPDDSDNDGGLYGKHSG